MGSGYLANFDTTLEPDNFSYLGINVAGFNTSPANIGTQMGTAVFTGRSRLIVSHGSVNNVFATGDAVLNADFDAGTIDELLTVSTEFADLPANATAENSEISILPKTLDGVAFETRIALNPGDFGMETFAGGDADGQFFGVDASGIGGFVSGAGTKGGGATHLIVARWLCRRPLTSQRKQNSWCENRPFPSFLYTDPFSLCYRSPTAQKAAYWSDGNRGRPCCDQRVCWLFPLGS
ncbi:MAG: hypothetical protein AAGA12_00060 [Pseudomonadota bacterium]